MRKKRFSRPAAVLAALLAAAPPAAAEALCDPGLEGSSRSAMAYTLRGDRCEGLYALQVNSRDVRLASLVETFALDPEADGPLRVTWPAVESATGPVRLRAQSLRPRSYYRMDTAVDPAAGTWLWPTDVLAAVGLLRDEVGVLGWYERAAGDGEPRPVYLPLRIAPGGDAPGAAEYEIALVPDIRLREVFVTLAPVGADGVAGAPIVEKKPLEMGYYPAKQATVFRLPKPAAPGLYELEIVCRLTPSGDATATYWIHHAG